VQCNDVECSANMSEHSYRVLRHVRQTAEDATGVATDPADPRGADLYGDPKLWHYFVTNMSV